MSTNIVKQETLPQELQEQLKMVKESMLLVLLGRSNNKLEFTLDELNEADGRMTISVKDGKFTLELEE